MGFYWLLIMAVIAFSAVLIGYIYFKKDALVTFAIGSAVASNIFNISSFGIKVGNLTFGIDSIIYTVFIFCVLIVKHKYNEKDLKNLTYTSIVSILFAAIIQLIAELAIMKDIKTCFITFASFLISAGATFLAILITIKLSNFLKKKNVNIYFSVALEILSASLINSIIYFSLFSIVSGGIVEMWGTLFASYIGKFIATIFAVLTYLLINKFEKRKI